MELARRWDELIDKVRMLPGFEDFLRPPPLEKLLPFAEDGAVVVVNVSRRRCDALIVTAKSIQVRNLGHLTAEEAATRTNSYLLCLQAVEQAWNSFDTAQPGADATPDQVQTFLHASDAFQAARKTVDRNLRGLMAWLWDTVAGPVLDALDYHDTPESDDYRDWPRLWWCPTGPLTLLPLHAAGYHGVGDAKPRTVLDRVVSSYTPTLRALDEARKPIAQPEAPAVSDGRMLMVALANTPGQPPLPQATAERDIICRIFPPDQRTVLEDEHAVRKIVSEQLLRHRWVHFSCHGTQDLTEPSRGGLLLYDDMLTVADVSAGHHRGEFAFLSACKTATGGVKLLDEAITLTAALHHTGYRHVIGTLWSVYATETVELVKHVYANLTSPGVFQPDRAAFALHRAIRKLRDANGEWPSVWTPFTHTGP